MVLLIFCVKGIEYASCGRTISSQKDVQLSHFAKKHIFPVFLFANFIDFAGGHKESAGPI